VGQDPPVLVFPFAFREDARFVHKLPEGFQGFPPDHRGFQGFRTLRVFDDLQAEALSGGHLGQGIGRVRAVRDEETRQGREGVLTGGDNPAEDEGVALQGGFIATELGPQDVLDGRPALRGDPGQDPLDEAVEDGR
jgi:hypothetical protein